MESPKSRNVEKRTDPRRPWKLKVKLASNFESDEKRQFIGSPLISLQDVSENSPGTSIMSRETAILGTSKVQNLDPSPLSNKRALRKRSLLKRKCSDEGKKTESSLSSQAKTLLRRDTSTPKDNSDVDSTENVAKKLFLENDNTLCVHNKPSTNDEKAQYLRRKSGAKRKSQTKTPVSNVVSSDKNQPNKTQQVGVCQPLVTFNTVKIAQRTAVSDIASDSGSKTASVPVVDILQLLRTVNKSKKKTKSVFSDDAPSDSSKNKTKKTPTIDNCLPLKAVNTTKETFKKAFSDVVDNAKNGQVSISKNIEKRVRNKHEKISKVKLKTPDFVSSKQFDNKSIKKPVCNDVVKKPSTKSKSVRKSASKNVSQELTESLKVPSDLNESQTGIDQKLFKSTRVVLRSIQTDKYLRKTYPKINTDNLTNSLDCKDTTASVHPTFLKDTSRSLPNIDVPKNNLSTLADDPFFSSPTHGDSVQRSKSPPFVNNSHGWHISKSDIFFENASKKQKSPHDTRTDSVDLHTPSPANSSPANSSRTINSEDIYHTYNGELSPTLESVNSKPNQFSLSNSENLEKCNSQQPVFSSNMYTKGIVIPRITFNNVKPTEKKAKERLVDYYELQADILDYEEHEPGYTSSSSSENYEEQALSFDYMCWTEEYDFSDEDKFKLTSNDPIFSNAFVTSSQTGSIRSKSGSSRSSQPKLDNVPKSISPLGFRIPMLPPAKRPPSRKKSTASSSSMLDHEVVKVKAPVVSKPAFITQYERDDDVISLMAGSITSHCPNVTDTFIEPTIDESQSLADYESCSSLTNEEETVKQIDRVQQWVNNPFDANNIVFGTVPPLLYGICKHFFQYAHSVCIKPNCTFRHNVGVQFRDKLLNFSHDELKKAMLICKMWTKLYMETINTFVTAFAAFKDENEIWSILTDVFALPIFDKLSIIETCLKAFESFGLSLENIINKLLTDVANHKNLVVVDLILEYALKLSSYDVFVNWPAIKRLLTLVKDNKLDHGSFTILITNCLATKHKMLAALIFKDIIEKDMVDLTWVNDKSLKQFRKFVGNWCNYKLNNKQSLPGTSAYVSDSDSSCSKHSVADENVILVNGEDETSSHHSNSKSLGSVKTNEKNAVGQVSSLNNDDAASNNESDSSSNSGNSSVKGCNSNSEFNFLNDCDDNNEQKSNLIQELTDKQVRELFDVLKSGNLLGFLTMMYKYKDTSYKKSFILNSICFLKEKTSQEVYEWLITVLNCLEQFETFCNEASMLFMLRTLTMNMVVILDRKKSYNEASRLIIKFFNNLEGFMEIEWFKKINGGFLSKAGKFLYICSILVKGGYLRNAVDLLMHKQLKLLYKSDMWMVQNSGSFDFAYRDDVLKTTILAALDTDLTIAQQVIMFMVLEKDHISELDVWKYFSMLLQKMLETGDQYKTDLIGLLSNIIDGWYKHLSPLVLRGLLVLLIGDISETNAINLYKKCCKRKIYPAFQGNENEIIFMTDRSEAEIYMTLRVFFDRIIRSKFEVESIVLKFVIPYIREEKLCQIINNTNLHECKLRVCRVLATAFLKPILVRVPKSDSFLRISSAQLNDCINEYRTHKTVYRSNSGDIV